MTEQEAKARAIAQAYFEKSGPVMNTTEFQGAMDEKQFEKRLKYLKRFSKRFAGALGSRLKEMGSPLTQKDAQFMFLEMFLRMDVMKPIEMIGMFKMVGEWCGLSRAGEHAPKPQTSLIPPQITFRKVGS